MQCLHKLPAGTSETENGLFWFCDQKPSCKFVCSEDEGYLYEMGIIAFEKTNQPQPKCCGKNLARLRVLKDLLKQNYGRPFFVCSKDGNRCNYFEWGDESILPKPFCYHNETCVSWTVKKEGSNKGKKFFCCPRKQDEGRCKFFLWANEEEEKKEQGEDTKDEENTLPTKETKKRKADEKKQEKTTSKKRQPLLFYTRQTLPC